MNAIWLRILPYIAAVSVVLAGLFMAYSHGKSVTDAEWQAKWNARDTRDAAAKTLNESTERAKEQARQQTINKVIQDGQKVIDQAFADAAASRDDRSLRDAADETAGRVAASQAGGHSCTAAASAAATRAVMVLADVLKRADQRAGDLAGYADQSHGRGVTCEQAYDSLGK
ncbi:DUF2514 family protein [Pseudomonas fluorescens]|uniref:DUF2514 family protein n=1 Tax=Pseudomonas fluorescens TaxID=294 RepID=UPI0004D192E3|nr:DUF2514 family protein [Pseudomonas fluorescens]AIG00940.1 hypothetical protein HZ99_01640 [Pseudomonas fluorescens]